MSVSESCNNFSDFFRLFTELYGESPALFRRESDGTEAKEYNYEPISGTRLRELIYLTAMALEKFNIKPGDRAAIISESRFEWAVADFSCILKRIVTVPVYTTMTSAQIKYILEHSGSKVCFVSTKLIAEKVNSFFNELKHLQHIITFNRIEIESEHITGLNDLAGGRKKGYTPELAVNLAAESSKKTNPDDLLTIIYTSGTTGIPKGVCLSHRNILTNVRQCARAFPDIGRQDRFLSYLPLAHSYERTAGYYYPLSVGAQIYYAQSIDTLTAQFGETKPTVVTSVPMLFSRIYTRLMKNVSSLPILKRAATRQAFRIGMKYRAKKSHFLWRLADKRVFSKIRERTGGCIKFFISGGSALNREVAEFFDSIGIQIFEGYGMTESSPVISVNRPGRNVFGTVGIPLEGTAVRIADDGEILVKGDVVMSGYYKDGLSTKQAVIEGWLHTGDVGQFIGGNFLKITDRKKTLIKSRGGEYISLTHIEETLSRSPVLGQVITFSDDEKPFVTALISPDPEEILNYARSKNLSFSEPGELARHPEIIKLIDSELGRMQVNLSKFERVRKFAVLPKPFTVESGELTPTLKFKRKVIEDNYKDLIDSLYGQSKISF